MWLGPPFDRSIGKRFQAGETLCLQLRIWLIASPITEALRFLRVVRLGRATWVASRGSSFSMPPPRGCPCNSKLSLTNSEPQTSSVLISAPGFSRTLWTELVHVHPASFLTSIGSTPHI